MAFQTEIPTAIQYIENSVPFFSKLGKMKKKLLFCVKFKPAMHLKTSLIVLNAMLFFALGGRAQRIFYDKGGQAVGPDEAYARYVDLEKKENGWYYVKEYGANDTLRSEGLYSVYEEKDKKKEGQHFHYFSDGGLWYTDEYTSGQRDKELKSYYKSGALKRIERFSEFKSQGGECFEEDGKPKTFSSFESIPQYPGGEEGLIRYLIGAIQYPALARENDITGTVVVQFVVNRDGTVSDVQVVKDIGGGCGAEAARVVLAMPDWVPGYLDDKPVRVRYTLPVRFNLEPAKKKKRKKS